MEMTVLIVEDHAPLRAALAALMRATYPGCAIAEAGTGTEALTLARERAPGLVLLDIGLPDGNGLEVIAGLKVLAPRASVVVVSQHDAPAYVEQALVAGASAYVPKSRVAHELLPAILRVAQGPA